MNSNFLTNTLLAIIAALLLVQVIQTGMNPSSSMSRPMINPHAAEAPTTRNPSGGDSSPTMQVNMIFQALKAFPTGCQGKQILGECDSAEAQEVKAKIESFQAKGNGIRQTFDFIVATWGEKVLTEQALQIRKMRKQSQ